MHIRNICLTPWTLSFTIFGLLVTILSDSRSHFSFQYSNFVYNSVSPSSFMSLLKLYLISEVTILFLNTFFFKFIEVHTLWAKKIAQC